MYCMYLRKSRADVEAEARGEGETLARHEKILWDTAKRLSISIKTIYREVVSGETIASRPVMQQILSEVEQGLWQGIFVVEVERLARGDTMDQGLVAQTFKYSGTKIITPVKTYDPLNEFDEEYFEFGLFMSRREYKTINRRLQQGIMSSVKQGKYVGNIPPYGYNRIKIVGDKGYTLDPHPEQSPVVVMIFDLYINGSGVSIICRRLNDMKVPTAKGGVWVPATIRGILTNPVYIGMIRRGYRAAIKKMIDGEVVKERPRAEEYTLVKGLHKPLVSEEVFSIAQTIMAENPSVPAPKKLGVKNPLSGLIICGCCGRKMVRRPYGGKYPDTLMCPLTSCTNVSSHLHIVEDKLLQALSMWLDEYIVDVTPEEKTSDKELLEKSQKRLIKEINILTEQMNNLHDLLEQGIYSVDIFLERSTLLKDKLNQANLDKAAVEKRIENIATTEAQKKKIVPAMKKIVRSYWDLKTPESKNKMLKEVLDKVVYMKTVDGRYNKNSMDDFELKLYPKLPKHIDD